MPGVCVSAGAAPYSGDVFLCYALRGEQTQTEKDHVRWCGNPGALVFRGFAA